MLLDLNESRLQLLYSPIFDLALLAERVNNLIQALDMLLVLYLLLADDPELLHLRGSALGAHTGPKVADQHARFGPALTHR